MEEDAQSHRGRSPIIKEIRKLDPGEYTRYTSTHKRHGTNELYDIVAAYKIYDGKDVVWTADASLLTAAKRMHGEFEVVSGNAPAVAEQMVHERICARIDAGEF